jgi:hypothetical protein
MDIREQYSQVVDWEEIQLIIHKELARVCNCPKKRWNHHFYYDTTSVECYGCGNKISIHPKTRKIWHETTKTGSKDS